MATKEQVLPALASTVITGKYKGKMQKDFNFIASIYAPRTLMLSRMPSVVYVDKNNNCKLVIDNCAPNDITIHRNDVIGLMDVETEQLQPPEDSVISAILSDIDNKLPKVPKKKLSRDEIATKSHLNVPKKYKQK